MQRGPLTGLTVLDMSRLAPGPYASMLLADMGATVISIGGGRAGLPAADFARGKQTVRLNLKQPAGQVALHRLAKTADVFLEGFRPGVAASLNVGYDDLKRINPQIIYCSLTGYGQSGPLGQTAGHDINYLGLAGVLGALGPVDAPPLPPLNLLADLAGGGMLAALGILAAVYERQQSGEGQHVDVAMIDGLLSMMKLWFKAWGGVALPERGRGMVTGEAPYYRCYECSDGNYVAVGAYELQFFAALWNGLGMESPVPNHFDPNNWPMLEELFTERFVTATREEWSATFAHLDACVSPVLSPSEVNTHPHIADRHGQWSNADVPAVPLFSRTPPHQGEEPEVDVTEQVLRNAGLEEKLISDVLQEREHDVAPGLGWPPI